MSSDIGKKFEAQFKEQWSQTFPKTLVFRLKDQMSGYKEVSGNPCDFLCFPGDAMFMVECKEHKGASIPFSEIPQYERLLEYKGLYNVYPGVLVWFSEKDVVIWVGIDDMEKIVATGRKSIPYKITEDKDYNAILVPSIKKRVFLISDYKYLVNKITGVNNE